MYILVFQFVSNAIVLFRYDEGSEAHTMFSKLALEKDSPIDDVSQEVAEKELLETPERKAEAISKLRELLKGEANFYFRENICKRSRYNTRSYVLYLLSPPKRFNVP